MSHESAELIRAMTEVNWLGMYSQANGDIAISVDRVVAGAITGDADAVESLLRTHHPSVFRICYRMMGNREDAQDAAQEALVRMLQNLGAFDTSRPFMPWLYSITLNVCRDQLRRRKRHQAQPLDAESADTLANAVDVRDQIAANDELAQMEAALQLLLPKERAAIVLRDIEGLDTDEVATIMNTRAATVRSHICRGRTKLKLYRERMRREES